MSLVLSPGTGRTLVRLSQVPLAKRQQVANRVIRTEGLVGIPALELLLAAERPRTDPAIFVPADVAAKVLGRPIATVS